MCVCVRVYVHASSKTQCCLKAPNINRGFYYGKLFLQTKTLDIFLSENIPDSFRHIEAIILLESITTSVVTIGISELRSDKRKLKRKVNVLRQRALWLQKRLKVLPVTNMWNAFGTVWNFQTKNVTILYLKTFGNRKSKQLCRLIILCVDTYLSSKKKIILNHIKYNIKTSS